MPFVLGSKDRGVEALLAGGSYLSTAPLSNLQTDDPQQAAISTDAAPENTQVTVDLGASHPIGMFIFGPCNLTEGQATYRIRSYSDATYTTVLYDSTERTVTGTVVDWADPETWFEWEDPNFWSGIGKSEVSELPLYVIEIVPSASSGLTNTQWFKVEFNDPLNIDGRIEIGVGKFFELLRPPMNYAADGNEFSFQWLTDETESLGGAINYWERGRRRRLRVSWPALQESVLFDDVFLLALRAGVSRQVFVVPEENDTADYMRRRAFLATLMQSPPIAQAAAGYGSTSFDLKEVI